MENWFRSAVGRSMDPDRTYGLQCKDVIDDYAMTLWPSKSWVETVKPNDAKNVYDGAPDAYWFKTNNDPNDANQVPQRGDVIVWNGNMGKGTGHIAVVISARPSGFTVIEQDGFKQVPAYQASYPNYNNVIGWLTPKLNQPVINQPLGDNRMTPNFVRRTYWLVEAREPSQEEVDFHMRNSNPEGFVNGFERPKWKDLEKSSESFKRERDEARQSVASLTDSVNAANKQLQSDIEREKVLEYQIADLEKENDQLKNKTVGGDFVKRLTSRKFLVAIIAALVAFGNAIFNWGLTTEEVIAFLAPVLAYIGVEGLRDAKEVESK